MKAMMNLGYILFTGLLLAGTAFAGYSVFDSEEFLPVKVSSENPVSVYLVKFDLSDIPEQAKVDAAIVRLTADVDSTSNPHLALAVYPIEESWTGSSTPTIRQGISSDTTTKSVAFDTRHSGRQVDFDITETVQQWISGERTNHGIMIIDYENPGSAINIYTDTPGVVAQLHVTYTCKRGER